MPPRKSLSKSKKRRSLRLAATHGNDTPPDLQEIFGMGEKGAQQPARRGIGVLNGSRETGTDIDVARIAGTPHP